MPISKTVLLNDGNKYWIEPSTGNSCDIHFTSMLSIGILKWLACRWERHPVCKNADLTIPNSPLRATRGRNGLTCDDLGKLVAVECKLRLGTWHFHDLELSHCSLLCAFTDQTGTRFSVLISCYFSSFFSLVFLCAVWLSIRVSAYMHIVCLLLCYVMCINAFSALTLLVGQREGHPACKNWVVTYWRVYLSGARCKWFAYGPAASSSYLVPIKSRLSWKRGR